MEGLITGTRTGAKSIRKDVAHKRPWLFLYLTNEKTAYYEGPKILSWRNIVMEVGDKVKFKFGKKAEEKEGIVIKRFPKTVYLKVDFPRHKGKIIHRKISQLS